MDTKANCATALTINNIIQCCPIAIDNTRVLGCVKPFEPTPRLVYHERRTDPNQRALVRFGADHRLWFRALVRSGAAHCFVSRALVRSGAVHCLVSRALVRSVAAHCLVSRALVRSKKPCIKA
jgi:hypothetical protein